MTKQSQTTETQINRRHRSKTERPTSPELIGSKTPLVESSHILNGATAAPTTQEQAVRLDDVRLSTIQRQLLATQIGQVQGNQYLQQILASQNGTQDGGEQEIVQENPGEIAEQTAQISHSTPAVLQMSWLDDAVAYGADAVGDFFDSRPDEARLDAQEEMAQFIDHGEYEELNFHPSTGAGLFDAKYDPGSGKMIITVKICYKFEPGDPTNKEWIDAVGAKNAATYTPDQFVWQPGEADQWKQAAKADLESFWSNMYTFHSTRPYWESLPPVNVQVVLDHDAPADGDAAEKAHFVVTIRKWPKDGGLRDEVNYPDEDEDQETAHFEESADNGITQPDENFFSDSTDSQPKYGDAEKDNPKLVFFEQGSAEVPSDKKDALKKFGETLGRPDMPPFPVDVTGRASPEGEEDDNMTLAEDRAQAVADIIISTDPSPRGIVLTTATGEEGTIDYEPIYGFFRRVDIEVDDFDSSQTTIRHEFGHMIGLKDQYPDDSAGRSVGEEVGHSDLAEELIPGQDPILVHDNEDIMSAGEMIQPYHYVTFLEALGEMTDTRGEWDVR